MAIRRASKSSISTTSSGKRFNLIAGYSPAVDEMDLIQRVTVGVGGASTVTFSSIPQTYQHLQIRFVARTNGSNSLGHFCLIRFNSDSSGIYSYHEAIGNGSTTSAASATSITGGYIQRPTTSTQATSTFGSSVVDIINYKDSISKVVRGIGGWDSNGSGLTYLYSNLWASTTAINAITLSFESASSAIEGSVFSLYGVIG